jgi:hypothetical protein
MIDSSCTRQRFHGTFLKQPLDAAPLGTHIREPELVGSFARNHDEIHAVGQQGRPLPEALAAEPFHAVALHGAPDLARHDQPEPSRTGLTSPLRRHEQGEVGGAHAASKALRPDELLVLPHPAVRPEGSAARAHGARCIGQQPSYFL